MSEQKAIKPEDSDWQIPKQKAIKPGDSNWQLITAFLMIPGGIGISVGSFLIVNEFGVRGDPVTYWWAESSIGFLAVLGLISAGLGMLWLLAILFTPRSE